VQEGELLWEPSPERRAEANLAVYLEWLHSSRGLQFDSYDQLWRWSVDDLEEFWSSIWDHFGLAESGSYEQVLSDERMPGTRWFAGASANYAERALRRRDDRPALLFKSERLPLEAVSHADLYARVRAVAATLRDVGVRPGDRVVGYMPNIPETVVAFLAAASIGAVWSCCSPDLGVPSVLDRFRQIEPSVLFAVDGYVYGGKAFDRRAAVGELQRGLPTLRTTIVVPSLAEGVGSVEGTPWPEADAGGGELEFERLPFDHPLWILYSSGTTGLPKAIVHGHGGILLEHLKVHSLHLDLHEDDRFFWFTSTNWMMWNFLVSGLLVGSTLVLFDGSPTHPDMSTLWRLAEETRATFFGTSAPFIQASMAADVQLRSDFDLSAIRAVGSTASPLPVEGFGWVYEQLGDVLLGSASGGTDVCTPFVGPCPLLPVHAGELQCRFLGAAVAAYDEQGVPVIDEVGELVVERPMPSMPLYFWNDPDGSRYRESYFDVYPGVWRHGDWIRVTQRGSSVIYGRSDSTIKRGGIRTGTSEFYRLVEALPEVEDSLVIDTSGLDTDRGEVILFIVLAPGLELSDTLVARIEDRLRTGLSPRHVPDRVVAIDEVPRTLNGKKVEVPVKRILAGELAGEAVATGALSNPHSLDQFLALATPSAQSDSPPHGSS
jgi:acetoacetyl-CoA synthetase